MDKSKGLTPMPLASNFSQNNYFRLEHVSSFAPVSGEKEKLIPSYLEKRYCSFKSNPSIISCRAFDNSISFTLDILFPTFEEDKDFKIISHEFESIDILKITPSKVIFEKMTENKNEIRFFLITVKFKITISVDPLKGNFALLQTGEHLYSLFMNDHNVILK